MIITHTALVNGLTKDQHILLADLAKRPQGVRFVTPHAISTTYDVLAVCGLVWMRSGYCAGAFTMDYEISDYGRRVLQAPRLQ